jgi:outer membrane protein
MKKSMLSLVCLFVVSLLVLPGSAFAFLGLEVGVGYWKQDPSGTLEYQGTSLDLKNDLKFDSKYKPYARVKAELPLILPNIYLMATPMEFSGTGNKTVTFGGQNFTAGFDSKLKMDHYDIALYYPLPFIKTASLGVLNAELGINARIINFEGTLHQPTTGISTSKKLTLYVPMIYAGIQVKPTSSFSIEAEGRGIAYSSNHYYDIIGRLKVMPAGPLFIGAGYRYESIKIDASDVKADIKFTGPFVEAGLVF